MVVLAYLPRLSFDGRHPRTSDWLVTMCEVCTRREKQSAPKRPVGRPRKSAAEKHERKMQTQEHRRQGEKMARENQEWLDGLNTDDAV